ncbi:MAG: mechanosensitive ion channel [Methanoregula sp.]|jgi:small-conductance mechanosensitive channel|nr:mechanosensitive ion channel [Methanoregula sp.]
MDHGILYAVITLAAGLVLGCITYGIIRWLKKKADTTETRLDDIILMAVGTPLVIAVIALSAYIALTRFDIIPESMGGISTVQVINAVFILLGAWIASVFLQNLIHTYGAVIAEKTETDLNRLIPILLMMVRYLIWFVVFLLLLAVFQVDITPFLAGAGIAGIALALAAQDILGNFLGSAIIAIDKPFRIGDRVRIDTFFGDVISLGPRSTRIKTLDNQIVTIPNSTVTQGVVINYAMPNRTLKIHIPFSVAYGSDIEKVTKILLDIASDAAEKTSWVMTDPAPSVYFLELGESSLNGRLLLWTYYYDYEWDVKDWVNRRIARRFKEEKIEIPFRQLDIWMRNNRDS